MMRKWDIWPLPPTASRRSPKMSVLAIRPNRPRRVRTPAPPPSRRDGMPGLQCDERSCESNPHRIEVGDGRGAAIRMGPLTFRPCPH